MSELTPHAVATRHESNIDANASPQERKFALVQRQARALASSELIPKAYQGNVSNCMIALELAERTKSSPFMVMQNVHVIQGRPSWSSQFIIAAINACGRFSPLQFRVTGDGDSLACTASAVVIATGELVEGPEVTWEMAVAEGWATKPGSKWKTMPNLMVMYRSATFFGRLYAPEILMGMQSSEEILDVSGFATARDVSPAASANDALGLTPPPEDEEAIETDPDTGEVIPSAAELAASRDTANATQRSRI